MRHLDQDILLITDAGVIIRTGVETIRVCGRASQGVILMRLDEGVRLISLATAEKEEEAKRKRLPQSRQIPPPKRNDR